LLALFNGTYIPYEVAFSPDAGVGIDIFNYSIDVIFTLDIIVCFRSTYFYMGEEIYNSKLIA